jgi:hypothetical protein
MTHPIIAAYASLGVPEARDGADGLSDADIERILEKLLPGKVYPGEREAGILDWIFARVTDARGVDSKRRR